MRCTRILYEETDKLFRVCSFDARFSYCRTSSFSFSLDKKDVAESLFSHKRLSIRIVPSHILLSTVREKSLKTDFGSVFTIRLALLNSFIASTKAVSEGCNQRVIRS